MRTFFCLVAMGEHYTDACICAVADAPQTATCSVAAASPATVGVILQMRRAAEHQQSHN